MGTCPTPEHAVCGGHSMKIEDIDLLLGKIRDARTRPKRAHEFSKQFGENSAFHQQHGYYFDAVSPDLPTLPAGWEQRMLRQVLPCGVKVKYLDANDCAVSNYARSEHKDREWIRAGIESGILSLPTIEYRIRETRFIDDAEHGMAKASVAEDRLWFQALRGSPP